MGKVIVIDGPEKAGKSTLIQALFKSLKQDGYRVRTRHWGPVKPDDRVYSTPLEQDFLLPEDDVVIWDRSWVSEHVYGKLLNRQRRGANRPWLMEWLHSRAVFGNGARVMVLPEDYAEAAKRRTDEDLAVHPLAERDLFQYYAQKFGWNVYWNNYTEKWLYETVDQVKKAVPYMAVNAHPRYFTHASWSQGYQAVIVGEQRNPNDLKTMPGAWLPFSSARTTAFVEKYFGMNAFNFAWTNAADIEEGRVPDKLLQRTVAVYTFGERAAELMRSKNIEVLAEFAHPSFMGRWNTERGRAALKKFEEQYTRVFGTER